MLCLKALKKCRLVFQVLSSRKDAIHCWRKKLAIFANSCRIGVCIWNTLRSTTTTTATTNNCIERRNSRLFYNLLTAPRTVSNTYAHVAWAQSCANHVQHIEQLSRATHRALITCNMSCCVPHDTKGQLSY